MICVHRLRGDVFWVNPDLMVFVEGGPHQTAITLADGNRVTVHETPEEIAASVMRFRASVLVVADELVANRAHRDNAAADDDAADDSAADDDEVSIELSPVATDEFDAATTAGTGGA
jgi:uncharacterized protein YlzI (FlbEa/FlbD family)